MSHVKQHIWIVVIVIFTAILYMPSVDNGFLNFDDNICVYENPDLDKPFFDIVKGAFTNQYGGNYYPVTHLLYMSVYKVFGLTPTAYHLVSILLHLANIVLVYCLLQLLFKNKFISLLSAGLFAIHPLHTEVVSWIGATNNLTYAFFFLAAGVAYVRYHTRPDRKIYLWVTFLLFQLSLASKNAAIVFPAVMLIIDYCIYKRISVKLVLQKTPFFFLSLIFVLITLKATSDNRVLGDLSGTATLPDRILTVLYSSSYYLIKLLAPYGLSGIHYNPVKQTSGWYMAAYYLYPIVLAILVIVANLLKRHANQTYYLIWRLGILFYLVNILLVIKLVPMGNTIVADRYAYMPSIGLFVLVAFACRHVLLKQGRHRVIIFASVSLAISLLTWINVQRQRVWHSDETFFSDVIRKYPDRYYAYQLRGVARLRMNQTPAAIEDFLQSAKLNPGNELACLNLGVAYTLSGDLPQAQKYLSDALAIDPQLAKAHHQQGMIHASMGHWAEAQAAFRDFARCSDNPSEGYLKCGNVYVSAGQPDSAIVMYSMAIRADPNNGEAFYNRGSIYIRKGWHQKACMDWHQARSSGVEAALEKQRLYCK